MTVFQILGIIVVSLFYLIYLQRMIALRRKGINAHRLAKGSKDKRTMATEFILSTVTLIMPAVQYVSVIGNLGCLKTPFWLSWAGVAFAVTGVIFFLLAVISMKENWRAGIDSSQKTELVSRGIYSISRNPAFVGFDLFYIGIATVFPNVILVTISLVALILFHFQILAEERYMLATFGSVYSGYKKRVRRYL